MYLISHYEFKIFAIVNAKLSTFFYKLSWYWSLITIEKTTKTASLSDGLYWDMQTK